MSWLFGGLFGGRDYFSAIEGQQAQAQNNLSQQQAALSQAQNNLIEQAHGLSQAYAANNYTEIRDAHMSLSGFYGIGGYQPPKFISRITGTSIPYPNYGHNSLTPYAGPFKVDDWVLYTEGTKDSFTETIEISCKSSIEYLKIYPLQISNIQFDFVLNEYVAYMQVINGYFRLGNLKKLPTEMKDCGEYVLQAIAKLKGERDDSEAGDSKR